MIGADTNLHGLALFGRDKRIRPVLVECPSV